MPREAVYGNRGLLKSLNIFEIKKIFVSINGLSLGHFAVCKTVYTSSILVAASINIINVLH
jgi:hypothetical protein